MSVKLSNTQRALAFEVVTRFWVPGYAAPIRKALSSGADLAPQNILDILKAVEDADEKTGDIAMSRRLQSLAKALRA